MTTDESAAIRKRLEKPTDRYAFVRRLVRAGLPFDVYRNPDDCDAAGFYNLDADGRDISVPCLTTVRAMGGTLETR